MSKILFIFAHMDDETILSYGTLLKLQNNNDVALCTLCGNGRVQHNVNSEKRKKSYDAIILSLNLKKHYVFLNYDLVLERNVVKKTIDFIFDDFLPNVVITHNNEDLHLDHRLIFEEVLIRSRTISTSSIKELYTCSVPNNLFARGEFGYFQPNLFVDISDLIECKRQKLNLYDMELPIDDNDIRSVESIIDANRFFGKLNNTKYCEAYKQIFKII